jgi:hypothetical protein
MLKICSKFLWSVPESSQALCAHLWQKVKDRVPRHRLIALLNRESSSIFAQNRGRIVKYGPSSEILRGSVVAHHVYLLLTILYWLCNIHWTQLNMIKPCPIHEPDKTVNLNWTLKLWWNGCSSSFPQHAIKFCRESQVKSCSKFAQNVGSQGWYIGIAMRMRCKKKCEDAKKESVVVRWNSNFDSIFASHFALFRTFFAFFSHLFARFGAITETWSKKIKKVRN